MEQNESLTFEAFEAKLIALLEGATEAIYMSFFAEFHTMERAHADATWALAFAKNLTSTGPTHRLSF